MKILIHILAILYLMADTYSRPIPLSPAPVERLHKRSSLLETFSHFDLLPFANISQILTNKFPLVYRGMNLSLDIQHMEPYLSKTKNVGFYSGKVVGFSKSFVRLYVSKTNCIEGVVHIEPGLGSIHLESVDRYDHTYQSNMFPTLVYHSKDKKERHSQNHSHHHRHHKHSHKNKHHHNHNHIERRDASKSIDADDYYNIINAALTKMNHLSTRELDISLIKRDATESDGTVIYSDGSNNNGDGSTSSYYGVGTNDGTTPSYSGDGTYYESSPVYTGDGTNDGTYDGYTPIYSTVPQSSDNSPPTDPNYSADNSYPQQPKASNVCAVALIADYSFYQIHGEDSENLMMSYITEVSGYYEQQLSTTLGIAYTYVTKTSDDSSGFSYTPNDCEAIVPYINNAAKSLPGLDPSTMCLITVFSSTDLSQGAVGVSYVGTICQNGGQALFIQDRSGTMSRSDFSAVIMHEIGHSFGSNHDDPQGPCDPGDSNPFVMYPSVAQSSREHIFSTCSLNDISKNLMNPASQCMLPPSRARDGYRPRDFENATLIVD